MLNKVTPGAYNPATGQAASTTAASTLQGAAFDFQDGQTQRNGNLIKQGDKRLLLQAGGAVPTVNDSVTLTNGIAYSIMSAKEINPAGVPVAYDLHIRKS